MGRSGQAKGPLGMPPTFISRRSHMGVIDSYALWARQPEGEKYGEGMSLSVQHHPARLATAAGPQARKRGEEIIGELGEFGNPPWIDDAAKVDLATPEDGQQKLFGTYYRPGTSVVTAMFSTERHKAWAATMLGTALGHSQAERGAETLLPSGDLSPHSSRLVQGLQRRGLVKSSAANEVTNRNSWSTEHYPFSEADVQNLFGDTMVPEHEVAYGRHLGRQFLGQRRTRREEPVPEHPRLPGLD